MKIAYLINQYPKVSHSFIRREILALERQGIEIMRISVRGWNTNLVDEDDIKELDRTQYILRDGLFQLLISSLLVFFTKPVNLLIALRLALNLSRHSDRSWPFHLVYLMEACRMLPWIIKFGATHIHAHFGTNSAEVAMLASAVAGIPYSFTVHGPEEFDKPEFIGMGEKIRQAAFVVAITSYCRSQLFRWVSYADWQKIVIVHCGLESEFHTVDTSTIPLVPRIVCVGRLCEQKGQMLLVSAISQILKKGISIELVLAGDGDMRDEIEALIVQEGIQANVRITGWISSIEVRNEILAARALVLPSFAEGLPVVIMEAMALRRPVLSTYVAGIPELVLQGETGWLFPAGDIDVLILVLEEFLATPIAVLQSMGDAGYQRVLARHSIDIEAAKLARYFRSSRVVHDNRS